MCDGRRRPTTVAVQQCADGTWQFTGESAIKEVVYSGYATKDEAAVKAKEWREKAEWFAARLEW